MNLKGDVLAKRFSEIFGLSLEQPQLDFVDITPAGDSPLFIDPFAISLKEDQWSLSCHQHITHFFQTALDYIRTDKESEARALLNGLSEPNETCLGVSDGTARFCEANPKVLQGYKRLYSQIEGARGTLRNRDFDEEFDESLFAQALKERLHDIPPWSGAADEYHTFIVGTLEFIFWPNLIYPKKETPIHSGRKRIDVTYTNAAKDGFFYRVHTAHQIASNSVMVERKIIRRIRLIPKSTSYLGASVRIVGS
jgi:hypothetical protein